MRTIEFRGKDITTGEWRYGYYVKDPIGKSKIYWQPFAEASSNTYHFVIPETVGQFTGLTDKNGNKIFEGDRVNTIWVDILNGCDESKPITIQTMTDWELMLAITRSDQLEIIGNIHDNPITHD